MRASRCSAYTDTRGRVESPAPADHCHGRRSRGPGRGSEAVRCHRAVARGLDRVGLQHPAHRVWEWGLSLPALPELFVNSRRQGSDGLRLPPPILRVQATGTASPEEFPAQSHRAAETVQDAVRRAGHELEGLGAVLDVGCGAEG
jgi:hypothetical protein